VKKQQVLTKEQRAFMEMPQDMVNEMIEQFMADNPQPVEVKRPVMRPLIGPHGRPRKHFTKTVAMVENGDVLELTKESANVTGSVPAGDILIDGHQFWGAHSSVLQERSTLARNGIVFVTATIDVEKRMVVSDPIITSLGFVEIDESEELHKKTSEKVKTMLEGCLVDTLPLTDMHSRIVDLVTTYLSNQTGRRPTVISHIETI